MRESARALPLPFRHPALLTASLCGIGFLPLMPGSWGSLAAVVAGWAIAGAGGALALAAAAAFLFLLGWWAADAVVRAGPLADPGFVVVDEAAGQWLALLPAGNSLPLCALGFLLFRLFDIWKPWPANWAERRLAGGLAVMLDDTFAAGYALLVLLLVRALAGVIGVRS